MSSPWVIGCHKLYVSTCLFPTTPPPWALWGKATQRQDCRVRQRGGENTCSSSASSSSSSSTSTPLSGCHVLFVSQGRLSGDGDVARGSLAWLASEEDFGSMKRWTALAWERGSRRIGNRGDGECQIEGGGGGERRTHSAMSLTWESFRQAWREEGPTGLSELSPGHTQSKQEDLCLSPLYLP